jgi:putative transcriptional regulator
MQLVRSAVPVDCCRARLGRSQTDFARMIGVSIATLQNWEQGRRAPGGPALALLRVADADPHAVERALRLTKAELLKKQSRVSQRVAGP